VNKGLSVLPPVYLSGSAAGPDPGREHLQRPGQNLPSGRKL